MTTKRILLARRAKPVLSLALELYCRGVEIIEQGAEEIWEDEGGRRREFGEIEIKLQDRLGRRPWEATIFEVAIDGNPPPHCQSPTYDWAGAQALRRQLQAAFDARRGQVAGVRKKRGAAPATTDV